MKLVVLIGVLGSVAAVATLIVIALYVHKRAAAGDIKLIGEIAQVDTKLDPEGTVIVCGELWRARSKDGVRISAGTKVNVVGFDGLLALVEVANSFQNTHRRFLVDRFPRD
jgi:membrane-bound ClpP family serine protease